MPEINMPSAEELDRLCRDITEEKSDQPCYNCGKPASECVETHCCETCARVGYHIGHTYSRMEFITHKLLSGKITYEQILRGEV